MPALAHSLIAGLAERDQAFYAALRGEDELGMVVRAHIHIEHELRAVIMAVAPVPNQVRFSDLDFEATVRLALILGVHPEFKSPLAAIGKLRNKFSHRLDMKLGKSEADDLYKALGAEIKKIVQKTYDNLRADNPDKDYPKKYSSLDVRDRIMTILISIRGGLIVETLRLTGKL
jgi:hypothetical protein